MRCRERSHTVGRSLVANWIMWTIFHFATFPAYCIFNGIIVFFAEYLKNLSACVKNFTEHFHYLRTTKSFHPQYIALPFSQELAHVVFNNDIVSNPTYCTNKKKLFYFLFPMFFLKHLWWQLRNTNNSQPFFNFNHCEVDSVLQQTYGQELLSECVYVCVNFGEFSRDQKKNIKFRQCTVM